MSRTARLLELLVRVQARPRFTAQELAQEFGVSRRTMLRDLATLSEMGVPLRSTPGPGGGYSLPRGGRRLSPSLTVDELLGMIVSYESFLRYSTSPFKAQNLSAVTKLRAALPKDMVVELEKLRRHVAVLEPVHEFEAPLLGVLLEAALDGAHLKVSYDSATSGISERVVFPFGVYAAEGFWYCACLDYKREKNIPFRADRFLSVERVEGFERPVRVPLEDWMDTLASGGECVNMRAYVSARGAKRFELAPLLDRSENKEEISGRGGVMETSILRSDVDYWATRLLSVGTEVKVETPPELVQAIRDKAREVTTFYGLS